MKIIFLFLTLVVFFSGCNDSETNANIKKGVENTHKLNDYLKKKIDENIKSASKIGKEIKKKMTD